MRLLLDTHVVLWQLSGTRPLGPRAAAALSSATELRFSVVSFAEIGVKVSIGKLQVPPELRDAVEHSGVRTLGLTPAHGLRVAELPLLHRDPFDRLLIAQARAEGLTFVTADERIAAYDVETLDPRV